MIGAILLLTVTGTFIFMKMAGIDLQRISLGALVIALGIQELERIVERDLSEWYRS